MQSGKGFDLNDFKMQIVQMRKMGGMSAMMDKLPAQLGKAAAGSNVDDKQIIRTEGIINSMTPLERSKPELIKASRKRRIAMGAGVQVMHVNQLLNQFEQNAEDDEDVQQRRDGKDDARHGGQVARHALVVGWMRSTYPPYVARY